MDDPAHRGPPALAPFRTRGFRWQWPADLITAWALEMESLILGWFVLVETGSVGWLTVFGALMYAGTLLSPLLGMLGDRLGLRRVLVVMRLCYALLAGVILALALAGRLGPMAVLAVAFVVGLIKPSDIGLRTALVSATVPAAHLVAAMGISRTTGDSARIGGALAGAGFMASLGMASAYGLVVGLYLLSAILTARSGRVGGGAAAGEPVSPPDGAAPSPWRDLLDGVRHVWLTPALRAAMLLAALVNLCAFPLTGGLMPYIARDVFQLDQRGLGWLVAGYATGALSGSLIFSAWGQRLQPGRTMILACIAWQGCLLGLALPLGLPVLLGVLLLAGLNQSLGMVSLSVLLLRCSQPRYRGRVMGVRMLAIYTLPLGLLAAGAIIAGIGFPALVGLYVGIGVLATTAIAWTWRRELLSPQGQAQPA